MFLIPLGLNEKLRIIPWASLLIAAGVFAFSVIQFEKAPNRARQLRHLSEETGLIKSRLALGKEYCAKSEISTCLKKDLPNFDRLPANAEALPSFENYQSAKREFEIRRLQLAKQNHELMRGNSTLKASLKALFSHAGWAHLIGNLLVFLSFAFFLEQRIGSVGLLFFFIFGGIVSNILQIPFLPNGIELVGASGAISAIIGAFTFFYWRGNISVLVSFFFLINRKIELPCKLYILLFFVLGDAVGVVSRNSNIAHMAHLAGFLGGVLCAFAFYEIAGERRGHRASS